jgi:hypothetical protein
MMGNPFHFELTRELIIFRIVVFSRLHRVLASLSISCALDLQQSNQLISSKPK